MKSEPAECSIDDLAARPRRRRCRGPACATTRRATSCATTCAPATACSSTTRRAPSPASPASPRWPARAYPDATQFDPASRYFDPRASREAPRWLHVDVRLVRKTRLLPLAEMREAPALATMRVLRARQPAVDHAGQRRRVAGGAAPARRGAGLSTVGLGPPPRRRAAGAGLLHRLPGRAARRRRRHADGALRHLRCCRNRGVAAALAVKMAIATSMATIVFTSLSSAARAPPPRRGALGAGGELRAGHRRRGLVAGAQIFALLVRGVTLALLLRAVRRLLGDADAARPQAAADAASCPARRGRWRRAARSACSRRWSARAAPSSRCRS